MGWGSNFQWYTLRLEANIRTSVYISMYITKTFCTVDVSVIVLPSAADETDAETLLMKIH
jgi:hypothetical protein